MSMERIPDYLEPIIAWRGWRVMRNDLVSTGQSAVWPADGPMEAECVSMVDRPQPVLLSTYEVTATPEMVGALDGITFSAQFTLLGTKEDVRTLMTEGVTLYMTNDGEMHFRGEEPAAPPPPPPHRSHRCGLYAVANPARIPGCDLWGAVELTGRVVPAEHGWRAQRARIIALADPNPSARSGRYRAEDLGPRIAARYGVPFVKWTELPEPTNPKEVLNGHR